MSDTHTFLSLCTMYKLTNDALFAIARQANVGKSVLDVMMIRYPVDRNDAAKVLSVLSQMTGHAWSLNNVEVPLVEVHYG